MEGLTAFVSRFDEEKQEKQPRQSTSTTEQSQAGNMPSAGSSAARSLPFSIEEILSDKRHSVTDRQQNIPREDVQKKLNDYSLQGKKT